MLPKIHLIYGFLFSLILFLIFPSIGIFGALIILLSSIFIDVDHYLYYVFKKRDLNFKRAFIWCYNIGKKYEKMPKNKREDIRLPIFFLHGIEPLIICYILSLFFPIFSFILIGLVFHIFLDFLTFYYHEFYFNRFSIIYEFINSKKLKAIEDV